MSSLWLRILNACGIDQMSWLEVPGLLVVALAFALVIYAFYKATLYSIWPHEPGRDGIKQSIFDERVDLNGDHYED